MSEPRRRPVSSIYYDSPAQRDQVREYAARRGMSASQYLLWCASGDMNLQDRQAVLQLRRAR